MQDDPVADIYLMRREKSRTGCLVALVVLAVFLIIGIILFVTHRGGSAKPPPDVTASDDETALAEPAPDAAPDAPPTASDTPPAPRTSPRDGQPAPASSTASASAPDAPAPDGTTAPAVPPSPENAMAHMTKARSLHAAGDLHGARIEALNALDASPGDVAIESFLSDLAMPLLASTQPMPEKIDHIVQRGEYLGKLAATYNTPVALIAKANGVKGALIRVGETLRVFDGNNHRFALEISKSHNDLTLTLDGRFFKRYRVATGRAGNTPVGSFVITDKIAHPAWHKPGGPPIPYGDPDNLLGTHWLAINKPGYGLHGTWDPDSIGQATSDGCIRLLNEHIEELYTILPKGTPVNIVE